jgi:hypothetical protein
MATNKKWNSSFMRTTLHYSFSINKLDPTIFFKAFSTSSTSAFVASIAPSECITIAFESTPSWYLFYFPIPADL